MKKWWGVGLAILLFSASGVGAHPVDELGEVKAYDQKQILEMESGKATLTIDLTFYALDKMKVWESVDKNKDKEASSAEKAEWMVKGQEASWLEVDGNRIDFVAKSLDLPSYFDFFSYQPAKVKIEFEAEGKWKTGQEMIYHYQGKDKKLAEIELAIKGGGKVVKISEEAVGFEVRPEGGMVLGVNSSGRVNKFLEKYVKTGGSGMGWLMVAVVSAFVLGALHALTPGHGKAMVAGYLVGEKGTIWHAVNLGLIITVTHTASVFILGVAALLLTAYVVPGKVIKGLSLISGVLVLGFGVVLLVRRIRKLREHEEDHDHEHHHDHEEVGWKNLLALGISGGMVPCVDALAILVVAVSLQKIALGIGLLLAFSLGLATALVAAGVVAVVSKGYLTQKYGGWARYEKLMGVVSALVVTFLGLGMLIKL